MNIRRVVTGRDRDGRSVLLSDGVPPRTVVFQSIPGHALSQVWTTPASPVISAQDASPANAAAGLLPQPGGTSLLVVTFPPDSTMASPNIDPAAADAEYLAQMPDLAQKFEPECPGMHTTDTIDYAIVLSGEVWLDLDDGQETLLRPNDIVVQQGTRHAWRNKTNAPATIAFFMIGATRP